MIVTNHGAEVGVLPPPAPNPSSPPDPPLSLSLFLSFSLSPLVQDEGAGRGGAK